jgi:ribulose-5-phosphate 4-epimerase/fuculose-1-phosphate aldolase
MSTVQSEKKIHHIIGGGTVNPVRSHFVTVNDSPGVDAYGQTARYLQTVLERDGIVPQMHLTKMASSGMSHLRTNDDIKQLTEKLVADPRTQIMFFNVAMTDYNGEIDGVPSGRTAPRLKTREQGELYMHLTPAEKIVNSIRKERKDIFLVAFKATTNASPEEQYAQGLRLLKDASANLVLANDTVTHHNMVIVPEEERYFETTNRDEVLNGLVKMALARKGLTFTHSTVLKDKPRVAWNSEEIPDNLRQVVDHLIARGAYQPFLGKTAGHFAVRGGRPGEFITSARKENFNNLASNGMIRVFAQGADEVVAWNAKPSVGGQSQRIVFTQHPDLDCIAHFHGEMRADARDVIPVRPQWPFECGSHECGRNTSEGLAEIAPGIKAVMLEKHGPNVVFGRNVPAAHVIDVLEKNFALGHKTGGAIPAAYQQLAL